jgi:predicted PurR-regulated permease PerM
MVARNNMSGPIQTVVFTFALALTGVALWMVRDIMLITLTAIIFSILLTTPIRFLAKRGVPRPLSIIITVVLIIAGVSWASSLVLPGLLEQFQILVVNIIPRAWELVQGELRPEVLTARYPFLEGVITGNSNLPAQLLQQLVNGIGSISGQVFPVLGSLVGGLVSFAVVIFLSLYFVASPDVYWRGMLRLVPIPSRPRMREIMQRLDLTLRRYLQAQIILMLMTGAATIIALGVLGIPLAGALGVITGLFSFIPNFGPIIAVIPIIAVVMINTPAQLGTALLIFFAIQLVVSQVVTPLLIGQEMNLPPAIILISQLVAGIFFGFLGLLLSVPLTAIIVVFINEIYVRDILGDGEVAPRSRSTAEMEAVNIGTSPTSPQPSTPSPSPR